MNDDKALLEAIRKVQTDLLVDKSSNEVFEGLLNEILSITQSEYGFIGDIHHDEESAPFLKTRAITNIAWDEKSEHFYAQNAPQGLEFRNLDTLFGHVIKTGKPLISNNPKEDKRSVGIPKGHPALNCFLGLPIYLSNHFIGMIGVANKQGGYDENLINFLKPLLQTCAHIIQAFLIKQQWQNADKKLKIRNSIDKEIFDKIIDGIITINSKGIVLSVNPAVEKIVGFLPCEMIGHNISMIMPEPHKTRHDDYLNQYHLSGKSKIIGVGREVEALHKNGHKIPLDLSINVMTIDNERIYVGIIRDIRERKLSEKKLHETTSIQKAILDSANFTIISTNTSGIIKTFNSGAERLLGYKKEEVINLFTPEIIHEKEEVLHRAKVLSSELNREIKPGFEVFVAKTILGMPDENEWTYIRKDGSRFPVLLSVTALYDENQQITGFLGVGSDITEKKKVEKAKNEFVSSVSHELRTPLTSIRGSLGLILGGVTGEINEKTQQMIKIANSNCERLIRLINDILDIEKIKSGKMSFKLSETKINNLIERTILANESYAKEFGVKINFIKKIKDSQSALIDSDKIIQVITNLLSNAIKYSPKGEIITVSSCIDNNKLVIEISDKGEGIPFEFQSNLFEKFTQADSSNTKEKGGTGLGLNIAKEIVEKHQGQIGFKSRKNHGTTFHFSLPLNEINNKSNIKEINPYQEINKNTIKNKRIPKILHVEDDNDIAEVIKAMISDSGTIFHCSNIVSAKELLNKESFNLAILDMALPDGNGLDLIPLIKKENNCSILILSAYDFKNDTKMDVDGVLIKSQNSNERIKNTINFLIHNSKYQYKDRLQ